MQQRRWTSVGLLVALALGLALGTLLGRSPAGLAQPGGEEEKAPAPQDEAAVREKREAKRAQLAAEAEAAGLTLEEYLKLRRAEGQEKQRMAARVKQAELSAPPVVEIHEPFLFVIKARVVYQFDLQTLELRNWASLDPPEVLEKKAWLEQQKAEKGVLQVK